MVALAAIGLAVALQSGRQKLRFEAVYEIAVKNQGFNEVSGLALAEGGGLWSVSDDTKQLFLLDAKGKIASDGTPGETGLEGIESDAARGRILAVREDTGEILVFGADGTVQRHYIGRIEGAAKLVREPRDWTDNNGLEGITVEPASGAVFVVKERDPRLLIELDPALKRVRRALTLTAALGFRSEDANDDDLDVSGLAWDAGRRGFWITSDTGKSVYFLDLRSMRARGWALLAPHGGEMKAVSNAEGVALSADGGRLFIVTDDGAHSRLLVYRVEG